MVIDIFIPENASSLFNLLPLSTVCSTYQRLSSCFEIFLANFKLGIQQPHFAKGKLQKKTKTLFTKGRNVYTNIVSYRRRRNHCNLETFISTILVNKNCIVIICLTNRTTPFCVVLDPSKPDRPALYVPCPTKQKR